MKNRTIFYLTCLGSLTLYWPALAHEPHQPHSQLPPAHEMPTRQLQYITHTPPSRWELQGVVAPRDLARLLLARIDHRFGNEGDFGRPERFSESFAIDPVQVE